MVSIFQLRALLSKVRPLGKLRKSLESSQVFHFSNESLTTNEKWILNFEDKSPEARFCPFKFVSIYNDSSVGIIVYCQGDETKIPAGSERTYRNINHMEIKALGSISAGELFVNTQS